MAISEAQNKKKIAVVGSGISGLAAAYFLARDYEVSVFEAADSIGGHTATKQVVVKGEEYWIDTGFIVFNDRTYPNFLKLLAELKVEFQKTDMGFSVSDRSKNYEYSGTSLNGIFAQRKNFVSLKHWRLLLDILRFNKLCITLHEANKIPDTTLGEFLVEHGFSRTFSDYYILPMVSAIWSSGLATSAEMPLLFFIRFFFNHGLLTVTQQPQWYTLKGGSKAYLEPLSQPFKNNIHVSTPIQSIKREPNAVLITTERFGVQSFDEVVLACHSDQALKLLADPSPREYELLSAITYKENEVLLHTDTNSLPKSKRAWASWNYTMPEQRSLTSDAAALTYNMNILQCLTSETVFCVSVNAGAGIDPNTVLGRYNYSHPQFTKESVNAQAQWVDISGVNKTHFCGAYWRNGFHEDGLVSALRVAEVLGIKPWQ